jgi:AraC-like DNA-binding protein
MEAAPVKGAMIVRARCTPHVVVRGPADCRKSTVDGFNVSYWLAGASTVEEGNRTLSASAGDIVIRDGSRPCRISMAPDSPHEIVIICIPRASLAPHIAPDARFDGVTIVRKRTPVANCLELLAQSLLSATSDELASVYEASLALLPLELDRKNTGAAADFVSRAKYLLQQILAEIERELGNIDLSPEYIAQKFNISVRYVHKPFAATGDTCRSYILQRRLDRIRQEITTGTRRQEPISTIVYRWGFVDVPTFNRAFKKRFGCTPGRLRGSRE